MSTSVVGLLQTLGNDVRKGIITSLVGSEDPLRFSDLMEASGLSPNHDTGQFNYHLNELIERNIIMKDDNRYHLTQFGFKIGKLLEILERESSFLLSAGGQGNAKAVSGPGGPAFRIRLYKDSDFQNVARLLMNMYNDAWSEMFGPHVTMSLEKAKKAVTTDLLVPDTRVLVLEQDVGGELIGFISYAIRYGGIFFIEYEWVETKYSKYGCDDILFERVEDEAKKAGETSLYIRVSHREDRFIEFLAGRGYETLNMLELAKYLGPKPKDYSGKEIEIEGHKLKLR